MITRQVAAGLHDLGLAERDHVVRRRDRRASIRFAVQALVLEEQHRIIATNRGAQQARSVQRIRGKDYAQARECA